MEKLDGGCQKRIQNLKNPLVTPHQRQDIWRWADERPQFLAREKIQRDTYPPVMIVH